MGDGVVGVAVLAAELNRDSSVGVGGQDVEDLLEIGPMILRVPIGDPGRLPATDGPPLGLGILTEQTDRGGIVVEFLQGHLELADGIDHASGEEAAPIGVEEAIERPPDLIIGDILQRALRNPECGRGKSFDDLLLSVDRLPFDEDRSKEYSQSLRIRKLCPSIIGWNIFFKDLIEAEAIEESVDDGKRAEPFESNVEAAFVRHGEGK